MFCVFVFVPQDRHKKKISSVSLGHHTHTSARKRYGVDAESPNQFVIIVNINNNNLAQCARHTHILSAPSLRQHTFSSHCLCM